MKKVHLNIISIIYTIVFIIALTGCTGTKDNSGTSGSEHSTIRRANEAITPAPSPEHVTANNNKPSVSPSGDNITAIDYNKYIKKIWVVESWDGGAYDYFSFFISKIENGIIEGKLSTRSIAQPDFYFYSLEPSKYLGDLSGTVHNDVAECQFSDKVGNRGNVTLLFKENDEIEATIEYMDKGQAYKEFSLDGKYLFRPYNLEDIKGFTLSEEFSFEADLNFWGSVDFVSGNENTGDKVHPAVYLINEHNDILYVFTASFKTGSEIIKASIKDINMDGFKDVMIITSFIDDPEIEPIEWIFYQIKNGLFYDSELDEK